MFQKPAEVSRGSILKLIYEFSILHLHKIVICLFDASHYKSVYGFVSGFLVFEKSEKIWLLKSILET